MSDDERQDGDPSAAWEKVVDIGDARAKFKGLDPYIRKRSGKYCRHMSIEVDGDQRKVFCVACEAELDPIQALLTFAHEWTKYDAALHVHKGEAERRFESLEEVKRQETNAKSRLRGLRKKIKKAVDAPFDLDLVEMTNSMHYVMRAVDTLVAFTRGAVALEENRPAWLRDTGYETIQAILDEKHPNWRRWVK